MEEYIRFKPSKDVIVEDESTQLCYCFQGNQLYVKSDGTPPSMAELRSVGISMEHIYPMGFYKGHDQICMFSEELPEVEGMRLMSLRDYSNSHSPEDFSVAGKAFLLADYARQHQHCGVCGGKTEYKTIGNDRAFLCSSCGHMVWPRVSNAIIVAVIKGDKILLAHNKGFTKDHYSVLAGFVEMGEALEDTVRREVFEETGVRVKNIRYFGSQAWPFPNSYMLAFTADYDGGEIKVDEDEIEDARWFSKEEAKALHRNSVSISSRLIEWFLER